MTKTDANQVTHWKKQFNYDYLGAHDLNEGEEIILTINETKRVEVTNPDGKKSMCFVAYFKEPSKPMILNKTNCKTITKVFNTPYIEEWKGIRICIYVMKGVRAFGDTVDALRVKNINPDDKTLDEIKKLFELHKKNMSAEYVANASGIIQSKQHLSYPKLLAYLKSL